MYEEYPLGIESQKEDRKEKPPTSIKDQNFGQSKETNLHMGTYGKKKNINYRYPQYLQKGCKTPKHVL